MVSYYLGPGDSLENDSLCFLSDENNHDQSFLYQVQTTLNDYLKANQRHIKNLFNFVTVAENSTKAGRTI